MSHSFPTRALPTAHSANSTILRPLSQECERLIARLQLVFSPDDLLTFLDLRDDELKMGLMVIEHSLEDVRSRLDRAGVNIYSETPMLDKAGAVKEIVLDLTSYSVILKLSKMPEAMAEAA